MIEQLLVATGSLGAVGLAASGLLVYASRRFAVEEDPLVEEVATLLPGANCGACGFPGCRQLAERLAESRDSEHGCPVLGSDAAARISALLGMTISAARAPVATLLCQGTEASAKSDSHYTGIPDCRAATLVYKGEKSCAYGCLGLGTCIRACPFDAIHPRDGIVTVDANRCTGCGKCVEACPKTLLAMLPRDRLVYVACASRDRGPVARKLCKVACIACTKCVRVCEKKAVRMEDNVAVIEPAKCDHCGKCVAECPTSTILQVMRGPSNDALPAEESC